MAEMTPDMQQGQGQQDPQSQIADLVQNLGNGLSMFAKILEATDPQLGEEGGALLEQYTTLVEKLQDGGAQQPQQASGPAPMEVGAADAQPMSPARR